MRAQILTLSCLLPLLPLTACDGGKADDKAGDKAADEAGDKADDKADDKAAGEADDKAGAAEAAPARAINLNTASEAEFKTIPGVGDKMAHEFEEYRPWVSVAQFRKEIGKYVDADKVAEYERYVFVPIDFNGADALTLEQIEGIDAAKAEALVAGRPYADVAAFEAKVTELGGDAAKAKSMLAPAS